MLYRLVMVVYDGLGDTEASLALCGAGYQGLAPLGHTHHRLLVDCSDDVPSFQACHTSGRGALGGRGGVREVMCVSGREGLRKMIYVCVCVCVCEREREIITIITMCLQSSLGEKEIATFTCKEFCKLN